MADDENKRTAERYHDELNKHGDAKDEAAIRSGEAAIKAIILANGGAIIAVLSFLGSLSSSNKVSSAGIIAAAGSLIWFALGVAAGLVCMCLAYLTNLEHTNLARSKLRTLEHPFAEAGPWTRFHDRSSSLTMWLAIVSAIVALGFFLVGIWDIRDAIVAMHN